MLEKIPVQASNESHLTTRNQLMAHKNPTVVAPLNDEPQVRYLYI